MSSFGVTRPTGQADRHALDERAPSGQVSNLVPNPPRPPAASPREHANPCLKRPDFHEAKTSEIGQNATLNPSDLMFLMFLGPKP